MELTLKSFATAAIVALAAAPVAVHAQAAAAGRFVMAVGAVQIQRGGAVLQARNGGEIRSGDTIRTAPGASAQVWLTDGSMVAIRERSEFRIDSYRYAKEQSSGTMGLISSIVKGGARLLTGAIGKANPGGVKVNTRVALIGIRGTGFDLVDCVDQCVDGGQQASAGLYGSVFEGQISITNENGTDGSASGETFYVSSRMAPVVRLERQPTFLAEPVGLTGAGQPTSDIPPPDVPASVPPVQTVKEPVRIEVRNITGQVPATPPQQSDALAVPTVTFNGSGTGDSRPVTTSTTSTIGLLSAEYNPTTGERNVTNFIGPVALGTTAAGSIASITFPRIPSFPGYVIRGYTAKLLDGGSDEGVVSWGRWADGSILLGSWSGTTANPQPLTLETHQGFHWMVGPVTTTPVPAGTYRFDLIGGTTPTEARSNAEGGWALTKGSLVADLVAARLSGTMELFLSRSDGYGYFGMDMAGSLAGGITGKPIAVATSVNKLTGSTTLCTATCNGIGSVLFFGNDPAKPASHAGLTYDFNTGQGFLVQGLAVFGR